MLRAGRRHFLLILLIVVAIVFLVEQAVTRSGSDQRRVDSAVVAHLLAVRDDAVFRLPPANFAGTTRKFEYLDCTGSLSDHEPSVGIQYRSAYPFDWEELQRFYHSALDAAGWRFTSGNAVGRQDFFRKDFPDWQARLSLFLSTDGRLLEVSVQQADKVSCVIP